MKHPEHLAPKPAIPVKSLALPVAVFFILIAVGFFLLAAYDFRPGAVLDAARGTNPMIFLGLMILLPLAGFPIAAFYLYAGAAFPWLNAWLICTVALAVNIAISYPIGIWLLRKPIARWMAGRGYSVPELREKGYFRLVFLVRSIPGVPYPVQNYMLALAGAPFWLYWVLSLSIQSIFAAGMTSVPNMILNPSQRNILVLLAILTLLGIARMGFKYLGQRKSEQPPRQSR